MIFGRNPKNKPEVLQKRAQERRNKRPDLLAKDNRPSSIQRAKPRVNSEGTQRSVASRVVRYTHLPGIFPRIRELGKKFGHFAYIIALIYRAVNLLPASHPYLNAQNIGEFGMRDVIGAAANNVKIGKAHIDQIAVFSAVLLSLIMIGAQVLMIGLYAVVSSAQATSGVSFFETANPEQDIVFIFLDQVFGNTGVFESGATALGSGSPVHAGLTAMLSFYSMAMMVLAVFIVAYYVVTIVGEAAISGTPFGRRFNSLWAPLRLVVALGLLVPIAGGLNSAQYITLYVAKMGSGLATNAWGIFVDEMAANGAGDVFVKPQTPELPSLITSSYTSEVCAQAYNKVTGGAGAPSTAMQAYFIAGTVVQPAGSASANALHTAARSAGTNEVKMVWSKSTGAPYEPDCGELGVSVDPMVYTVSGPAGAAATPGIDVTAIDTLQIAYIQAMIDAQTGTVGPAAQTVAVMETNHGAPAGTANTAAIASELNTVYSTIQTNIAAAVAAATTSIESTTYDQLFQNMQEKGWGGAAIWYARIGNINARFTAAVQDAPQLGNPVEYSEADDGGRWWNLWTGWGSGVEQDVRKAIDVSEESVANFESTIAGISTARAGAGNPVAQLVSGLFAINHVMDFRKSGSATLDPMVGMMSVGEAMVQRSIWALGAVVIAKAGSVVSTAVGFAAGGPVGAGVAFISSQILVAVFDAIGFIAYVIMILGLGAGFLLFYLLPLMPFIYFFFAIVSWIMEIFEAIVAMPLWALAHLKIDGDGLPGPLAINGYFLLLGIFLRPVLIVFGLIGGYLIFGAGAYFMFSTFDIVLNVVRGDEEIGYMGDLIYALIFVYLAYNLAITCFKMVDTVPQGILRWIGQGGATPFSDNKQDPIQGSQAMIFAAAGAANMLRPSPTQPGGAGQRMGEAIHNRKGGKDGSSQG